MGKTTFCQRLQEKIPESKLIHFGLLPPNWNYYWDYVERMSLRGIWDRGHISEHAYCFAAQRQPNINPELDKMINATLVLFNTVKVGFIANPFFYARRIREMQDDKFDGEVLKRANNWFLNHEFSSRTFDITFHLSEDNPWPTDYMLAEVLEMHSKVFLNRALYLEPVHGTDHSFGVFPTS